MALFTPEDLVMYLYKETSSKKTAEIESTLQHDWVLQNKLEVLKSSVNKLDKMLIEPRPQVITNILNYARRTEIEPV